MTKAPKRYVILFSLIFIFVVAIFAGIRSDPYMSNGKKLIEVCRNGIVYVPFDTKLVKCNGKVMRVIRIEKYYERLESDDSYEGLESDDCLCPNCCDGECAIIVSCDMPPEGADSNDPYWADPPFESSGGQLCFLWLACD